MPKEYNHPDFYSSLSPSRQIIADRLFKHNWFLASTPEIQKEVLTLPEDHDGFLSDLADRPDEIGELDVLSLKKIGYGHYVVLPVFEVRSHLTNQIFTYEYTSWKMGAHPGSKGVVFLETNGKITHFLLHVSHRFSTGSEFSGSIGGFYLHFYGNKAINFPKDLDREIRFHLGVDELNFKDVISLGSFHPDSGKTNDSTDLYAAIIDISEQPRLVPKPDFRTTHKPIGFEIKVVHISELPEYLDKITDGCFLSAISRLFFKKDFDLGL